MTEIRKTEDFEKWIRDLRDKAAVIKIVRRIERLEEGNPGDVNHVWDGITEMKIDFGPGYPVYYKHYNEAIVVLLCGGDKDDQESDIKRAKVLAKDLGAYLTENDKVGGEGGKAKAEPKSHSKRKYKHHGRKNK